MAFTGGKPQQENKNEFVEVHFQMSNQAAWRANPSIASYLFPTPAVSGDLGGSPLIRILRIQDLVGFSR